MCHPELVEELYNGLRQAQTDNNNSLLNHIFSSLICLLVKPK